jgi:2-iminobutanoate/2-iminopropanoate deaminase
MPKRTLKTERAPAAIGPYVQGTAAGDLIFTAMQIGLDPDSGALAGPTLAEQTRRCLDNVRAVVEAGGGSLASVVKTTVYLTDLADFGAFNEIYAEMFADERPARGVVGVAALPAGALVAIEAVACLE